MINNQDRKMPGTNPKWAEVQNVPLSGRAEVQYPTMFDMVRVFHILAGLPARGFGEKATPEDITRRIRLIVEECEQELLMELTALSTDYSMENLAKVLDSCADLCYVTMGVCVELGLPFDTAFSLVQEANMRKVKDEVVRREDGKILKPEGWIPPNILGMLQQFDTIVKAQKVANSPAAGTH